MILIQLPVVSKRSSITFLPGEHRRRNESSPATLIEIRHTRP